MSEVELTALQAGDALGLHINTVHRYIKAGRFPRARLPYGARSKGWVIPSDDVLAEARQGHAGQVEKAIRVIERVRKQQEADMELQLTAV